MNIALLVTIVVAVALAGFIVKYDKQIVRAAVVAGKSTHRHRRIIIPAVLAVAIFAAGYAAASFKAYEWKQDHMQQCLHGDDEQRGGPWRMPSNMDINVCAREWSEKPWYTRAGLLRPV